MAPTMDFFRLNDDEVARRRAQGPLPGVQDETLFSIGKAESALIVALYELFVTGLLPKHVSVDIVEGEPIDLVAEIDERISATNRAMAGRDGELQVRIGVTTEELLLKQ